MMDIQLELEKSITSPTAFFYLLPMMKHFPSQIMRCIRKFSSTFNKFIQDCLSSHLDSYNPGRSLKNMQIQAIQLIYRQAL